MITSMDITDSGLNELAISIYFLGLLYALFGAMATTCLIFIFFLIWHGLSRVFSYLSVFMSIVLSYLSEFMEVICFIKLYYFGNKEKHPQKNLRNSTILESGLLENCMETSDTKKINLSRRDLNFGETEKEKAKIERRYKRRRKSKQFSGAKKEDCNNNDILERVDIKGFGSNSYSKEDLEEIIINEIVDKLILKRIKSKEETFTSRKNSNLLKIDFNELIEEYISIENSINESIEKQKQNSKSQILNEKNIQKSDLKNDRNKIVPENETALKDVKYDTGSTGTIEFDSKIPSVDKDSVELTEEVENQDETVSIIESDTKSTSTVELDFQISSEDEDSVEVNEEDQDKTVTDETDSSPVETKPEPQIEDINFPDSAVEKHLFPGCKEDVDAIW